MSLLPKEVHEQRKAYCQDAKPHAMADLKAGVSVGQVAMKYGINRGTIRRWKRELDAS